MAARRGWLQFSHACLSRLRDLGLPAVLTDTDRYVVFLALRPSAQAEFVLRNTMFRLGGDWGLQILVRRDLEDWVDRLVGGWRGVHVDFLSGDPDPRYPRDRNDLMRLISFWENVRGHWQLFIDEDSIICHSGIGEFFGYDYVAPAWGEAHVSPWCRFGSGGLSFRRKAAMMQLCDECNTKPWMITDEDVFFSITTRLEKGKYRLPSDDVAARFAVERRYHPNPFALHRTWEYIPPEKVNGLLDGIRMDL